MPSSRPAATALLAPALLAACASPLLLPEDRKEACDVVVEQRFAGPTFKPNSLSSPAGTLTGAGRGALEGLGSGGLAMLVTVPLGLVLGAGYGTVCAVASSQHPTANADFERLLGAADAGAVKRALESRLKSPRPECTPPPSGRRTPDAVVQLEGVEASMPCLHGAQEFSVVVKWRTVVLATGRVLNESITRRDHKSPRDVAGWFAHPDEAKTEIELVLAQVGDDIAAQFVDDSKPR